MATGRFWHVSLSILGTAAICALMVSSSAAQMFTTSSGDPAIHGVPPSVTSFGFGGVPGFHGVPASVTSLNFGNTFTPAFGFQRGAVGGHAGQFGFRHHRFDHDGAFGGIVAVPYAVPVYILPEADDSMEQEYNSGPTIFDRTSSEQRVYPVPPQRELSRNDLQELSKQIEDLSQRVDAERAHVAAIPEQPVAEQPHTVLVFKDGHQIEVTNYAVVGSTLYDFSGERERKIGLAELDISATVKQNDDRGVQFQVPAGLEIK